MANTSNHHWFDGLAGLYNSCRPSPPAEMASLVCGLASISRAYRVVDLGCGTGLSTKYWAQFSKDVVGIEPNSDMLRYARKENGARNIRYVHASADLTKMVNQAFEVVCCFQSFHLMEPQAALREISRILKVGGVFVAADYDWPPLVGSWQLQKLWLDCISSARRINRAMLVTKGLKQWDKSNHLKRMERSRLFRYTCEVVFSHTDRGGYKRYIDCLYSQALVAALIDCGVSEQEIGIDRLRTAAKKELNGGEIEWRWNTRIRVGVK